MNHTRRRRTTANQTRELSAINRIRVPPRKMAAVGVVLAIVASIVAIGFYSDCARPSWDSAFALQQSRAKIMGLDSEEASLRCAAYNNHVAPLQDAKKCTQHVN
jgi:hypothetical protein